MVWELGPSRPLTTPRKLPIAPWTTPAPIEFGGGLYLFYSNEGSGGENKPGYMFFPSQGGEWFHAECQARGPAMVSGTSPCPVVFQETLYLFYRAEESPTAIHYMTTTGGFRFSLPAPIPESSGRLSGSGPAAIVHRGSLFVFWSSAGGRIQYMQSSDGREWSQPCLVPLSGIAVPSPGTTPAVVNFHDVIYLLFNSSPHDSEGARAYVTTFSNGTWAPGPLGLHGPSFQAELTEHKTSPVLFAAANGRILVCLWASQRRGRRGESASKISYSTSLDGITWSSPAYLHGQGAAARPVPYRGSCAGGCTFNTDANVFWIDEHQQLYRAVGEWA